jgi:uncharacterized membrane protein
MFNVRSRPLHHDLPLYRFRYICVAGSVTFLTIYSYVVAIRFSYSIEHRIIN